MSSPSRTSRSCGPDADEHVEVPGWPADRAGVTLAGEPDALAVVDPGRDLDLEGPLVEHAAGPFATGTRVLDDAARAAATRAGLAADELAERSSAQTCSMRPEPWHSSQVAAVVPGSTPLPAHSSQARATWMGTSRLIPLAASSRSIIDLCGDVGPATPARARGDAEGVLSEEGREDVGEAPEVERGRAEASALEARMAEAVVEAAGLGLREHLVRRDCLPEALLRVGLLRDVRVQLAREPAESPFDLGFGRRPADAEDLVVVTPGRRHRSKA